MAPCLSKAVVSHCYYWIRCLAALTMPPKVAVGVWHRLKQLVQSLEDRLEAIKGHLVQFRS